MVESVEERISRLPQRLEPEFVMRSPNEPIHLASGGLELVRDGSRLCQLDGAFFIEWTPRLRLVCKGEPDAVPATLFQDRLVDLHVRDLQLEARAMVTDMVVGQRHEIKTLLTESTTRSLRPTSRFRFYLVNFPYYFGEAVRYGRHPSEGAGRDRLRLSTGSVHCTIDRIRQGGQFQRNDGEPGYLLTHVAEIERPGKPFSQSEIESILDALHWLLAFMRGARTGPVLPSVSVPFAEHWISVASWRIDEPRDVHSWIPIHSLVEADSLFTGFLEKWQEPVWREALETMIAWYIAANSPSTPNEARITLCQIALEVLASLVAPKAKAAHTRIRRLLEHLGVPIEVPGRLTALDGYAKPENLDAPECLTRIRNKFEHPTLENRRKASKIDGSTRMEVAQCGLQLFELSLLAAMGYRGKYSMRAFRGWKGDDEIRVPWA